MTRASRLLLATAATLGLVTTSCGSDGSVGSETGASGDVVVFAASSLTEAFTAIGEAFVDENPATNVRFNFAGSGDLVSQIMQGAPADVFASADDSNMSTLTDAGENAGAPVVIARNTYAIIVETGNPTGITGLDDLGNRDLIVVLCADTVPCGKGAATILGNAGVAVIPRSFEEKVKGVVTKVTTGEADAGIVFVTDVNAAGDTADGVAIPADVNVITNYPVVVTKQAPNAATAQAFIDFVASDAGSAILASFGFLAP